MLFQKNILKKYAAALHADTLKTAWERYSAYFLDTNIQQNIKQSKEEQFQEGFLRELFVKVLGYTLNPSPNYNLITEQKNETNARKADGAILLNGKVIGIIELKDLKTTDLAKVEPQAFNYKSQHANARLVIISNFEKLRLYIDNAVDHREWNLFQLSEADFGELYLCLAWEQVERGVAIQMKQESVSSEEEITEEFYEKYSQFKRELFANILKNNAAPQATDEKEWHLLLFKKTQKLLDRLLFIFFAEDGGLLPPNTMLQIIEQWEQLKALDAYDTLYNRIKKYFGYLHTGHKDSKIDIYAYNGGLFKPDEVLDSLCIDDEVLHEHTRRLSTYDFQSEVDVNILGHIFEHSLTEIDAITTKLQHGEAPVITKNKKGKSKNKIKDGKRNKDGVFYTPPYITKYIVENTVGKLCREKKDELGIDESEYFADKKRQAATKKALIARLETYREWLLQISICDPACGSGAFLNAALNFLIAEHRLIDELQAKIYGASIVFPNVENSILENNLYGVDINEESVEIAKLSLWLRTAQPHRKLNSLNNNIKCGNSLIDDPAIAGDKAFNWQAEFPQVFAKGGFDVVIGNPPYGAELSKNDIDYLLKSYKHQSYQLDTYLLFTERTEILVKENGYIGFIMPNTWLSTIFSTNIRRFVFETFAMSELQHYSYLVFADATVETDVYIWKKTKNLADNIINVSFIKTENDTSPKSKTILQKDIIEKKGAPINIYEGEDFRSIKFKSERFKKLGDIFQIVQGTKPFQKGKGNPPQTEEILKSQIFVQEYKKDETYLPCLRGSLINRYSLYWNENYYISYGDWLAEPRYSAKFETKEKIVIRQTGDSIIAMYDDKQFICRDNLYVLRDDENKYSLKTILTILNSKFITWYYRNFINPEVGKVLAQVKKTHLMQLPIPILDEKMSTFADQMLAFNSELQQKRDRFLRRLRENLDIQEITSKLERFEELDFKGFVAELKNQKIKLSLAQQDEWEAYFGQYAAECQQLKTQIETTDKQIDKMVYELYGLTDEEIKIVDGNA